uniref:Peptidase S1 domain-containing protein n=1 Tax=Anopheles dirus TaxID=7168 RepID=A0A182NPP7_9DIPT
MHTLNCSVLVIASVVLFVLVASCASQSCGKRKVASLLIHNGDASKDGFWPWHAVLYRKTLQSTSYTCGGSIVDQNTVLTAAHCLVVDGQKIAVERLNVHVGRSQLWNSNHRIQQYDAYELIVHPEYDANHVNYDIALVKLSSDISYTEYVQPICLWDRSTEEHKLVGTWGTVVGFGLDESDKISESLREARVPVVSLIECLESNPELFGPKLNSRMICAGNRDGIGPCNGDSGGGLFFNFDDVWYIRGMVSFTKPREDANTCDLKQFTVFTDIAKYLDWIKMHMRGKTEIAATSAEERNLKIGLLPISTCGYNPHAHLEETLKPLEFGYPWMGILKIYQNATETFRYTMVSLLNNRYVLAVAKRIDYATKNGEILVSVILGQHSMVDGMHCGMVNNGRVCAALQELGIEKVIMHEGYREVRSTRFNNIALIRLLEQADLSQPNVKPICLPLTAKLHNEQLAEYVVTKLFYNEIVSRNMVSLVDRHECLKQMKNTISELLSEHVCFGVKEDPNTQEGNCNYFVIGSPLQAVQQVLGKQRYVLHGIAYLANYDCTKPDANVFVSVAPYIDWILDNIQI